MIGGVFRDNGVVEYLVFSWVFECDRCAAEASIREIDNTLIVVLGVVESRHVFGEN